MFLRQFQSALPKQIGELLRIWVLETYVNDTLAVVARLPAASNVLTQLTAYARAYQCSNAAVLSCPAGNKDRMTPTCLRPDRL